MPDPYLKVTRLTVRQISSELCRSLPVYYIGIYRPRNHWLSQEEDSVQMINLKNGVAAAAIYFAAKLNSVLASEPQKNVIAMPAHSVGCASPSHGLRQVLRFVSGVKDLSDCLIRHTEVPKSAFLPPWRRPTAEAHRASMRVWNPRLLNKLDLLLLDDVVTLGSSMCGASLVLADAGARSVTCLSLLSTQN